MNPSKAVAPNHAAAIVPRDLLPTGTESARTVSRACRKTDNPSPLRAIRFRPPALDPSPDLRWVVHRAFAKPETPVPPPRDPDAALEFALRLDLAARIGARNQSSILNAEIGPAAEELTRAFRFAVANALRHEATLRQAANLASSRGIPVVILKGAALNLLGVSAPGARSFSDLDLLVPIDRILELRSALVGAGWILSPRSGAEHQEAPLSHPLLGMIELHRFIPGVRPHGTRRSYDAGSLLEAGLTVEVARFGGSVLAPSRPVLIAHALVHGLHQHAYAAGSYPLFRFLADLQDLGASHADLREAGQLLRDIDAGDLGAVHSLLAALESGTALDLPEGAPRSLLHHLAATALNSDYALSLKANPRSFRSPSDLPPVLTPA